MNEQSFIKWRESIQCDLMVALSKGETSDAYQLLTRMNCLDGMAKEARFFSERSHNDIALHLLKKAPLQTMSVQDITRTAEMYGRKIKTTSMLAMLSGDTKFIPIQAGSGLWTLRSVDL